MRFAFEMNTVLVFFAALISLLHAVRQDDRIPAAVAAAAFASINTAAPSVETADADENADAGDAEKRLPQAIIIGVKKSGTRALLEFLRAHPDVRAPGPEMHFFDRFYDRGVDWYRSQMPLTASTHITIEKTPSYFITKQAPSRIAETYLDNVTNPVKLIVIVRNPIDRAVSDFVQTNSKYPGVADRSFEEMAVVKDQNGTMRVNSSWGSIAIGLYYVYMQKWLERFPVDRILVLSCEDLVRRPARVVSEVQHFLGLRAVITDDFFVIDSEKKLPCLTKRVNVRKDGSYTVHQRRKAHCLGRNKGRPHPIINQPVLDVLQSFYRPWNERFFKLIGKRFDWF